LDLAAHGWDVFPCKWRGKNAKAPLTTNGHLDASRNPDQITTWWTRWPSAMIGAPVPESLLVVDIDPRNGGSLTELESLTEALPPTLTAWSGRNDGGHHLYYLRPAGPLTSTRLPEGIDLKIEPPRACPAAGRGLPCHLALRFALGLRRAGALDADGSGARNGGASRRAVIWLPSRQ
jgi:Bifunctional DNA primase/polymerase, N-terminal